MISGTPGSDTLVGTALDETLSGDGGGDTYIYGLGGGNDKIMDSAGVDRLVLGQEADITSFESAGNDLIFSFADGGSVRVADMLGGQAVEELSFSSAPGTVHELHLGVSSSDGNDWMVAGAAIGLLAATARTSRPVAEARMRIGFLAAPGTTI